MVKPSPRKKVEPAFDPSVETAAAELLLASAHLGERIRKQRLKRSMGLVELGKLTGLSASFLSQLETGRVVPTLRNLARLSLVFNKDLAHFFDGESSKIFRVQRKKDRVRLTMGSPQPSYIAESFSILVPEGGLRPCIAEFLSGQSRASFHPDKYAGVEMVYVLSGSMQMERNGEQHLLADHDLAYVSGETERSYRCAGETPAHALIISFDDEGGPARHGKSR